MISVRLSQLENPYEPIDVILSDNSTYLRALHEQKAAEGITSTCLPITIFSNLVQFEKIGSLGEPAL